MVNPAPSLEEVLKRQCQHEWLEVNIRGFVFHDWVDSGNSKGDISSPSYHLISGAAESEYGTFSYVSATIYIEKTEESDLQNLKGHWPLGGINYYDKEAIGITVRVSDKTYSNLFSLLPHNLECLGLRIAIPIWENIETKCLPLVSYQLTYKYENEI